VAGETTGFFQELGIVECKVSRDFAQYLDDAPGTLCAGQSCTDSRFDTNAAALVQMVKILRVNLFRG
jgi:hypothetical protein